MSTTEINAKVKELRELRRMADELAAEIEAVQDASRADGRPRRGHPLRQRLESDLEACHQRRLDSSALKKELPNAARFMKQTITRRFVLA
ncbi:MAG: hypothetical protein ACLURW_15540 [Flavonifractor plautii]